MHDGIEIDPDRLRRRFESLSAIGATDRGGVNRPALSDANREARDWLLDRFEDAGLGVTVDEMGNLFGRRAGRGDRPPVVVGSHLDSQYDGGRFDGAVGVLAGLEIVEALNDAGATTRRPVEVVAWTNEEGVRFQPDMMGSGTFAGAFDVAEMRRAEDREGRTVGEELERIGYAGGAPCEPRELDAYLELHVEQGPYLEGAGVPVGVVEGVVGFAWLRATFEGQADHAGPTPMDARADALVAAADLITAVRRLAGTGDDLVGTVGSVEVEPNSINVIPERASVTVDLRSFDDATVGAAVERVREEVGWAAEREGVDHDVEELMRVGSETFADEVVDLIETGARERGHESMRMRSGAGHDAGYLARVCPTGMVFVPSVGGVSHTEAEFTEWEDVVVGAEVLAGAVQGRVGR